MVSHETALAVHGLGTLLPTHTHLTVPRSFRKPAPKGCRLHKAEVNEDEIEQREGFGVTTPLRTLLDVAHESDVTQEQLNEIVQQAITEGAVRRSVLEKLAQKEPDTARLSAAIATARP